MILTIPAGTWNRFSLDCRIGTLCALPQLSYPRLPVETESAQRFVGGPLKPVREPVLQFALHKIHMFSRAMPSLSRSPKSCDDYNLKPL